MLIAKGTYRAACGQAALGYSSKNNEQVALTFTILDEGSSHYGDSITWYGFFTEKTMDGTIKALRACGWQGDDLSNLDTCVEGSGGQVVDIVIEHEEDQKGEMRARVRWVNVPGQGGMKNRMEPDQASAFAARMKAQITRVKTEAKARPQTTAQAQPQRTAQPVSQPNPLPDGVAAPSGNAFDVDVPF